VIGIKGQVACAGCGTNIPYDRVEWILAALFLLLAAYFGLGPSLIAYSIHTVMLITLSAIDLRHRFVYTIVVYPALGLALLLTPLLTGISLLATFVGFAAGLGIFAVFYFIGRLVYRGVEPVGKGDIELGALMGAMVGFPRVVSALFLGSVVNAVFITAFLILRRRGRRDFVPYGPGLCLGVFATFFLNP
jgi:leader peptidase (prepilin peptidase) / N-methyltransferase